MARSSSPPSVRRRIDLVAVARQANHVVAAAVFVFGASILLGSVLATPVLTPAMAWILREWGQTAGLILGPLLIDGMYVVLLLGVAFPFGRVTAARPWVSGTALVLAVYGFWFSFHYVTGDAVALYNHWAKILARGTLLALTVVGVALLMARGRRAALEVDRPAGQQGEKPRDDEERETPREDEEGEKGVEDEEGETAPAKGEEGEKAREDEEGETAPARLESSMICKQGAPGTVLGGVR